MDTYYPWAALAVVVCGFPVQPYRFGIAAVLAIAVTLAARWKLGWSPGGRISSGSQRRADRCLPPGAAGQAEAGYAFTNSKTHGGAGDPAHGGKRWWRQGEGESRSGEARR